ncbi:MAG: hypothetical protein ACI8XX_001684 [Polaribacter sp.]|jgi:hypothetical protein
MSKKSKLICIMALPFACLSGLSHSADQLYQQVVGEATGLQSGESLYKEVHCGAPNELASDVFYQSSDGALIAHKTLDYGSGRTTPSFTQTYASNQEKVLVKVDQDSLVMSMTARDGEEINRQYLLSALGKTPVVIDAGFDVFIRDNWKKLVSGNIEDFQFPLVSRAELISLRVKKSLCQYETYTDQCFALEPSNWLFRMLAAPIELGYDLTMMRLNRYRGLSNINDENGDGLVVDIKYAYQETAVACNFVTSDKAENI